MSKYKKTVLDNGTTVLTEEHPSSHAVACGIWIKSGTRHESAFEMGISHFLEHMVFKGTKTRSAFQIARALESVGGDLNAYTTKEHTCYHSVSLAEHLPLALDVLSDLVLNAAFPAHEMELERGVILQEIAANQENHEEYLYDLFFEKFYGRSSMGFPILGTEETIEGMRRAQLKEYYLNRYTGSNVIVTVAGQLDHDLVVEKIDKTFGRHKKRPRKISVEKPRPRTPCEIVEREADQVHILLGFPAPSYRDHSRIESFVFNALMGGGMTSRLYQSVRERKGLVYSIFSSMNTFEDSGLMAVYASSNEKNFKKVFSLILSEFEKAKKNGMSATDLKMFKTQVRGGILLGAEDIENRMNSLGINEMVFGRYRPIEEVIGDIEKVTEASMDDFILKKFHMDKKGVLILGPKGLSQHNNWLKDVVAR